MRKDNLVDPLCIYHADCADGFAGAWVVRKALGDCAFHPSSYRETPPDVTGRDVILVDFSYRRDILIQLADRAHRLMVIDHHQTSQQELVDLPENVVVLFDQKHSGCVLAWQASFPDQPVPRILRHIEDRDLWTFRLPKTREIVTAIHSVDQNFETWDWLVYKADLNELAALGRTIESSRSKELRQALRQGTRQLLIAGFQVPAANLPPSMASDAGNELASGNPFAAIYFDTPNGRRFSLRSSRDGGIDVSRIAERYGGGGHRHAAGFTCSIHQAMAFEIRLTTKEEILA